MALNAVTSISIFMRGSSTNKATGNRQVRGVLLIRKILVDCYEGIEPRGRKRKQFAVLDAGPTFLNNRGDLM